MITRRFYIGILGSRKLLSKPLRASHNFCDDVNRTIEKDASENVKIVPDSVRNDHHKEKVIRVAMIGVPNVGKSTLINALAEHRICPVSRKVHTTRNFSQAITIRNNTQVIFFDTPGLVKDREIKKHHLEKSFVSAYRHSIQNADLIAVVQDVSNSYTRNILHASVLEALAQYPNVPSVLVLNKIDSLKSKRVLLDLIRTLTKGYLNGKPFDNRFDKKKRRGVKEILDEIKSEQEQHPDVERPKPTEAGYDKFSQVFMVSALNGDGVNKVMDYLCSQSKPKPWLFDADTFTDRTPEDLIVQCVRAKLLDFLPQEIPYQLTSELEFYSVEKGQIYASVLVTCPNKRVEKLVCGVNNGKLRQITECVTSDLIETFEAPISLTISTMSKLKE